MDRTALTVGGFTQPSVARNIIEQNSGAERGFSQRFLWLFPKPAFAKFASLKPVPSDISEAIGKKFTACRYSYHLLILPNNACIFS